MKKISLAQWTAELDRQIAALRPVLAVALEQIGVAAAELAGDKIGEYQRASGQFPEWDPLALSTVDDKTRLGYAPPDNPLLRTGEMRATITHEVEGMAVTIGSPDPVARYQEMGTEHIPPRPFIGPAMLETIPAAQQILGEALTATLKGKRQ